MFGDGGNSFDGDGGSDFSGGDGDFFDGDESGELFYFNVLCYDFML